jgi:ATP-dependent RNA helicase DeaD
MSSIAFSQLNLHPLVMESIAGLGYEEPSPIQVETIPYMLSGRDILGQAQTGTGKTAAFGLPMLSNLDLKDNTVQGLIMVPTRELALQACDLLQKYSKNLLGAKILPIFGGQSYTIQLAGLKKGAHIVVGTPGRLIDLIKRKALVLDNIRTLVLDEADEMLRMGFIDDVNWILEKSPASKQIALFSATMPREIEKLASNFLKDPREVIIKSKTATAATITQIGVQVKGANKFDALLRLLEYKADVSEGIIIFVKTKKSTEELADKLVANRYAAKALNGDIPQAQRESIIAQFKSGKINILVGTDVVARGLDVKRVTHVINFDNAHDVETYIHRIGRTGRAGRNGESILFVTPKEKYAIRDIERHTKQEIQMIDIPTVKDINKIRLEKFKSDVTLAVKHDDINSFEKLIADCAAQANVSETKIAAALASMLNKISPIILEDNSAVRNSETENYKIDLGNNHGIKPRLLVDIISQKLQIKKQAVGDIVVHSKYTQIELPKGLNAELIKSMQGMKITGRPLNLRKVSA